MTTFTKVLETLRIVYNSLFTLLFGLMAIGSLIGGLGSGPAWLLLGVPVFGWLAWSCFREDYEDVLSVWAERPAESSLSDRK